MILIHFVVLSIAVAMKYFPPQVDITTVNQNWKTHNCDGFDGLQVFGSIRMAIKTEYREVYLAVNSGWMDRFLIPTSKVHVTCVRSENLAWSIQQHEQADDSILHAIYSLDASSMTRSPLEQVPVDRFLLHNPCWIVVKDAFQTANASIHHRHSIAVPQSYHSSIVLLRMPASPLFATCKLFTAITARQFPPTSNCPEHKNEMFFYVLQSFGFGGESNKVIKTFAYNLASSDSRIYGSPLADKYRWSWADATGTHCSEYMHKQDPWSCTFLPISNCSLYRASLVSNSTNTEDDILQQVTKGWGDYGPKKGEDHKFLNKLGIDGQMLLKYNDGSEFSNEPASWVWARLYPYLLRPNFRTRALIRRGLDTKIVRLLGKKTRAGGLVPHFQPIDVRKARDWEDVDRNPAASQSVPQKTSTVWQNCLGIHVRNGDVMTDWRSGRKIDRSLNAHVYVARNLSAGLAVHDIVLATDNSSLLVIAPLEFPQYRWYSQQRQVNSLQEQRAKGSLHHIHEGEPQREIANLMVDTHVIGHCEALVGQGDGSITAFYHMFSCNLFDNAMSCPPFFDLQRIADDGNMPYIGARYDASTYAVFNEA